MRLAVIDCDTHSIRLLISDFDPTHPEVSPREVLRKVQTVGLGADADKTGHLAPEALNRAFMAVENYATRARQAQVDRVRMVATSASRDADNFFEFATGVEARLGVPLEVISGWEEATLGFSGTVTLHPGLVTPALVVDIGGGSTELSFGRPEVSGVVTSSDSLSASPGIEVTPDSGLATHETVKPVLEAAISMNMGSTCVTERCLRPAEDSRGIPSADAVTQTSKFVDVLIAEAAETVPLSQARTLIGVAGSVTTLTMLGLGLETYDRFRINDAVPSSAKHQELARELIVMPHTKKAVLGSMHPKRVDQVVGGALVWERTLAYSESQPDPDSSVTPRGSFPVCTSENDISDDLIFALTGAAGASTDGAMERGAQRD